MTKSKKENVEVLHDWWLDVQTVESWAFVNNLFNDEEIKEIHKIAKKYNIKNGRVGSGKEIRLDDSIRNSDLCFFNSADTNSYWIFQKITAAIVDINRQFWNFELNRIETLQYTVYNEGQFYRDHVDMMYESPGRATRKLSFTIQLTDPNEYEGGDLQFKTGPMPQSGKREKGTIIFFPSYVLHEVTPVTKGTRASLVGWVTGPAFK